MGLIYADLALKNPRDGALKALEVKALVDSGALMLCIPQHVASQLGLEAQELREATTADGTVHKVPYAGPVEVCFEDRHCYVGALVMGDDVLLGAVPMEDMDLIVSPAHRKLVANPESPNFPSALIK
jgi:clan AA aspartic protease